MEYKIIGLSDGLNVFKVTDSFVDDLAAQTPYISGVSDDAVSHDGYTDETPNTGTNQRRPRHYLSQHIGERVSSVVRASDS